MSVIGFLWRKGQVYMERFKRWLGDHVVEVISLMATVGFGWSAWLLGDLEGAVVDHPVAVVTICTACFACGVLFASSAPGIRGRLQEVRHRRGCERALERCARILNDRQRQMLWSMVENGSCTVWGYDLDGINLVQQGLVTHPPMGFGGMGALLQLDPEVARILSEDPERYLGARPSHGPH